MVAGTPSKKTSLSIKAHCGDAKTLLAFNFSDQKSTANLAGFTIACAPSGQSAYYLYNTLQFQTPANHAQDPEQPPNSSINAPFHKFRWLHVPGSNHQGIDPFIGEYTYVVTPRYFDDNNSLQPLDEALSVSTTVLVQPFEKKGLELGFTRGFTQSQAFTHHFGLKASIRPKGKELLFDSTQQSGASASGEQYTYQDEYRWLGSTARQRILGILNEVLQDPTLHLDMFAYDLNEPDLIRILLELAKQGRMRIILDNAALHHSVEKPTAEDEFEQLFLKAAKGSAAIRRGKFGRYSHDKVLVVSAGPGTAKKQTGYVPTKVLTGSTNFSVTGMYVNSNHVLVFNDGQVASKYAELFQTVWDGEVAVAAYRKEKMAGETFSSSSANVPRTEITFAPHSVAFATEILDGVAARIAQEANAPGGTGSVLFAVMEMDQGTSPVYTALKDLHANQQVFSYGISDNPGGIALYSPRRKTGVLVTGKPVRTQLPPPFDQVRNIGGVGHQVHHKFVVCGFNGSDPVVYCGSSNLALGGEALNGDNLLAIHDADVATAFALEALALVDHFDFLDRNSAAPKAPKNSKTKPPPASKQQAALDAEWFLSTTDKWTAPYFDKDDLHCVDRLLFGR